MAGVHRITLKHAKTKHAQTFDLLERSHASIKQGLRIETGQRRSALHKYVNIAVFNYNVSYHAGFGCEPCTLFHGRIPYTMLDKKMGIRSQKVSILPSHIAREFFNQTQMIYQDVRRNAMQAYITKGKTYYDKNSNASKLKEAAYKFVFQPKADNQGKKVFSRNFGGLVPTLLKKCYTILAPRKRKCFIACDCVSSHSDKPCLVQNHATRMETRSGTEPQT